REVSLLKSTGVDTELPDTSGTGSIAKVDPFAPTPGMVSTTNQGTPGNSNTPGNAAAPGSTDSSGNSSTANSIDNPNIKKPLDNTKPEVLIYHTHTTESYDPNGNYNDDPSKNVCAVGDVLTDELENKYGINVAHDKTIHNSSFNASYSRSRETVNKYLNKYGDFKLIIDLHRDAAYSKSTVTTKMNGENVADIRFVLCKKNPHFDKNLAVANSLADISNKYFPGFFKDIYYYNYGSKYFNQDLSNNAILIEVGANINTMDESKTSGKYIARIIAEYLNGKK
ncbi:MAG: stage II sporulation protein P, partial [Bacillota bacterium]|nr:stage II sporulation protein P [Bacillota bacterium]